MLHRGCAAALTSAWRLICTTLASTACPSAVWNSTRCPWLKLRGQLQFAGLHNRLLQSHHVLWILPWACTTFCQPIGTDAMLSISYTVLLALPDVSMNLQRSTSIIASLQKIRAYLTLRDHLCYCAPCSRSACGTVEHLAPRLVPAAPKVSRSQGLYVRAQAC